MDRYMYSFVDANDTLTCRLPSVQICSRGQGLNEDASLRRKALSRFSTTESTMKVGRSSSLLHRFRAGRLGTPAIPAVWLDRCLANREFTEMPPLMKPTPAWASSNSCAEPNLECAK
jgi:hypothetical protein